MALFLLLALVALFVSSLHMVAPDHWLPLTVISSAKSYSSGKKYGVAAALGFTHAGTSIAIALAVFYVGFVLVHSYMSYFLLAGQLLLVVIGIYFIVNGYLEESEGDTSFSQASALSVSAFPDLSIMPIIISAASLENFQIAAILTIFAVASGLSLTAMVYVAGKGLGKAISKVPPKYIDYVVGGVLILTALLIGII